MPGRLSNDGICDFTRVVSEEFIRRFTQHVLARGFQKVRHYGFAYPRRQVDHEPQAMPVTVTPRLVYELRVALRPPQSAPGLVTSRCKVLPRPRV